MEDGSSVRIKVAQYFVNKKIQELEDNDPKIKVDDLTLLQALPHYEPIEKELKQPTTDPELGIDSKVTSELPPLFPAPRDGRISWKDLLQSGKSRWIPDDQSNFPLDHWPIYPPWYRVAIIGAGVAGLRTAKLLQNMGIPYEIFEAGNRSGGRIFTYQFSQDTSPGKHDYYDVGAMRFPDNDANKRTFDLFKELNLNSKMIQYVMSRDDNIRFYNNISTTAAVARTAGDHFNDDIVPEEFLYKEYTDLRNKRLYGVDACIFSAYDPFRKCLINDFDKGWNKLMMFDWASTRGYLASETPAYPLSVVHWLETRASGTGGFDRAFSEAILDSLEFNDPSPSAEVKWWCLEGGSEVLIDAMLKTLKIKPQYGKRVTAVRPVYQPPEISFPNQQPWSRWPHRYPFPFMEVRVDGGIPEYFSHVVSTVPFANLRAIDTENVPMTYKQRQAVRTLNYGPAVKVGIKFKSRWWEQGNQTQFGGSSSTDRQSRVVVYPSYGQREEGPGVLMVSYNWHQDATRFGALIQNPDWSDQLDPKRNRPRWEKVLLDQIYADLAILHNVEEDWLREETLDYHAFDWYHNPYTMGAFAHFAPGQFSTFFADITRPACRGRFHFAGEVASHHHAWVAGALDSAVRVVDEIVRLDFPRFHTKFGNEFGRSLVFRDEKTAAEHFVSGLFSKEIEEAGF